MGLFAKGEKNVSPRFSTDDAIPQYNHDEINYEDVSIEPVCPPHTTEKKLLYKIDLHVLPFLCILYLLAFLDRVNISNANIFGLSTQLHLTGNKYNIALVIFFVPYILAEIPSNVFLKRLKPHVWLSGCMFCFGLVTTCQGLVQNYSGLLATRFLLGLFEAGMFPGCFYLIGMWYRRHEAQRRFSFFFSSTTLAGAFGGLLASAIGKMDYMRGYRGWRWIFILEGVLTCLVSLAFFFLIPDFPEDAKWLKPSEREYIRARLRYDQGVSSAAERKIGLRDVFKVLSDPKVIIGGFMYFGLIVPAYGYAYFAPGIIQSYGYSNIQTQLHSVPPWAAAFAFAMLVATLSDKMRHRMAFALFAEAVAIAGFAILITVHHNTKVQYAALFLVTMGAYSAMPIVVCWFNMNVGGHHRRSIGSAWQVGFGNIGGIIAVWVFLKKDAPKYTPGYSTCLAFIALSFVSCLIYGTLCAVSNKKRSREAHPVLTDYEKTELGDRAPNYRYLL